MITKNPREFPGFRKKSFLLPFGGGEIWCEHLDGIYENEELVIEKLKNDRHAFSRPSSTSAICFVVNETAMTENVINEISDALINTQKHFLKVCFTGADKKTERALKKALAAKTFSLAFVDDLEKAKEWLITE